MSDSHFWYLKFISVLNDLYAIRICRLYNLKIRCKLKLIEQIVKIFFLPFQTYPHYILVKDAQFATLALRLTDVSITGANYAWIYEVY